MTKWGGRRAQAWSRAVLTRYGTVCQLRRPGCTHVATTGDHKLPRATRPDLQYVVENGQPACLSCNSGRQDAPLEPVVDVLGLMAGSFESDGMGGRPSAVRLPPRPGQNRRVVLLFGPPGSGKTTLAHQLGLTVYDRDDHQWHSESQFVAAAAAAAAEPAAQVAIIRTGATRQARRRAVTSFDPTEQRLLLTSPAELHRRVKDRGRADQATSHRAITDWFRRYQPDPTLRPEQP